MKTAKDLIIPFSWEERRPVLLERFFYVPALCLHTEKRGSFFEKEQPVIIEYCSGNGQWIAARAEQFPQVNWIAVEKKFERARKVWLKSFQKNLSNLFVACSDALTFTRYYASNAKEVFINFPDPWPKRRHASLRLISSSFIEELGKITNPKARATCVTDDPIYAAQIEKEFENRPQWKLLFHVNEWPDYGGSFFKDLWVRAGRTIHYLSFEKQ